jgi:hypothetical protein
MLRSLVLLACLGAVAHADPATYAIVVGSNSGGPGQTDLRFAEDDARRVGALLVELGGYTKDQVDVIAHPSPGELRDRLAKLATRVAADAAAGRQTRVFFYYSGHARASAIDLGADELPLAELRQRLFAVQATLTVVVLDACQSGAFSRVKGAQPAADFSFNSRQHLDATGVAVLASSSGSELSQESEQLRSSYFTHHLLVGLRGAGDANGDGQVSIDEAYRYAYHQTLLATAETAVGGQHVTFEADLKGHGEVPLSFPRAATQTIELPARLEGQTLVEDKHAHAVIAETYKAKGAAVRIAVAPGDYQVIVRHGTTLSRCEVFAGGVVDLDRCTSEQIRVAATKGGGFTEPNRLELSIVLGPEREDAYTDNLKAFGYDQGLAPSAGLQLVGLRHVAPYLWVGGLGSMVGMPEWKHSIAGSSIEQKLDWSTTTLAAVGRGELPFSQGGWLSHVAAYAQASAGLGIGHTKLAGADNMAYSDTYVGPALGIATGLHFDVHHFGGSFGYAFDYAPVIKDLIGNTHASGGSRLSLAFTYGF